MHPLLCFGSQWREHRTEEEFSEQTTKRERCRIPEPSAVCGADSTYLPYPNTIFVGVSGRKLHRGDWIPFDGSEAVTRFGEIVSTITHSFSKPWLHLEMRAEDPNVPTWLLQEDPGPTYRRGMANTPPLIPTRRKSCWCSAVLRMSTNVIWGQSLSVLYL